MAKAIRLFDSSFVGTESASIGGDNIGVGPSHFKWVRDGLMTSPTFFTDSQLRERGAQYKLQDCVAWLLEPKTLRDDHYREAERLKGFFGTILTYDKELLADPKYKFYPYGGSWIYFYNHKMWDEWKRWNVSLIASDKRGLDGHKLRHDVVSAYGGSIDWIGGGGYRPVVSKFEALAPFRYSIVIESGKFDFYFTEKLIDCLSVGTIPIYWGCPSIGDFFNMDGIILVDSLEDIGTELAMTCELDYEDRREAVEENLQKAKKYRICEDWIWDNYPEVFDA